MSSKFAQKYNQRNESKRQGFRIRWQFDLKPSIGYFENVFVGHDSHCKKEVHFCLVWNSITR